MEKSFEELDYRHTSLGELILRRRKIPTLNDKIVYEVILNEEFLMSSLFHTVEVALAELGLATLSSEPLDVVIGGLGLGYTARAALEHEHVQSVTIVEYLKPVVEWHQSGLVPLGETLTTDPRTRFITDDFFALAASPDTGFDPEQPGRKFHAILLDIDHTPGHWLNERHATFYSADGLRTLCRHLLRGGVFALWADGDPDPDFCKLLEAVFPHVQGHSVRFPNPLLGGDSGSTVYVAQTQSIPE